MTTTEATKPLSRAEALKTDLDGAGHGWLLAPSGHVVSGAFAIKSQLVQRSRVTPGKIIVNHQPLDAIQAVKSGIVSEVLAKRVLALEEAAEAAPATNSSVRHEQAAAREEIKQTPEMRLVDAVLALMATRAAAVDRSEVALIIRNAVAEIAASAVHGR